LSIAVPGALAAAAHVRESTVEQDSVPRRVVVIGRHVIVWLAAELDAVTLR